jgi:hypothetical protein
MSTNIGIVSGIRGSTASKIGIRASTALITDISLRLVGEMHSPNQHLSLKTWQKHTGATSVYVIERNQRPLNPRIDTLHANQPSSPPAHLGKMRHVAAVGQ